jgi:DNA polymerase III epsilon subunit-like protein
MACGLNLTAKVRWFINYLYIDFETTGLDPKLNAPVELAAIPVIYGEEKEPFYSKIKPHTGAKIEEGALRVNKLTLAEIMTYPEPNLVANDFVSYIKKLNTIFTIKAYNSDFDRSFLDCWFNRLGMNADLIQYFSPGSDCVLKKARQSLRLKSYKLEKVCEHLNFTGFDFHKALDDIRATIKVDNYLDGLTKKPSIFREEMPYLEKRKMFLGQDCVSFGSDGSVFINNKATQDEGILRFILEEIYNKFIK